MSEGILRLLFELQVPPDQSEEDDLTLWRMGACSSIFYITSVDVLTCTDELDTQKRYRYENTYHLSDISKFLDNHQLFIDDFIRYSSSRIKYADWQVYKRILHSKRDDIEPKERQPGAVVVAVGMSPRNTSEDIADFTAWYDEEHFPLLREVPGWREGSRYIRVAEYGDRREFAAPFLAIHQYNQDNGLGGEQWRKSIESPWAQRVQASMSAENHRRVWRVDA